MPSDDDIDLMQRMARRDEAALADLYGRYAGLVYSIAMRVLQNTIWAEEAMQDTFLKIWREPSKWNPGGGQLVNWVATVARFTAIDRLRRERRQPALAEPAVEDFPHLAAERDGGDEGILDARTLEILMAQLPAPQFQAIQLAFWHGMSHSEISHQLGVPLGTVKSRIQLGMQKLREMAQQQRER